MPAALEAVCLKAMATGPRAATPGARELAADVERWLADEPVSAYREPLSVRLQRWGATHRTLVTSGVVLLVAGVVGLAAGLGAVDHQRSQTKQALEKAEDNLSWPRRT